MATYYGKRDYFECHDIMEEQWKLDAHSRYTGSWLVFVRIAVACYHARRGNWAGARKMMAKAAKEADAKILTELGLDGEKLVAVLRRTSDAWNDAKCPVYEDLPLPIADPLLLEESKRICRANGWTWDTPLQDVPYDIVHRHLTRDPHRRTPQASGGLKRLAREHR